MEFRTVLFGKELERTDKALLSCSNCKTITTTYAFKGVDTINATAHICRGCGLPLKNLEELSKKSYKRIDYHTT